ncbi:MAG TPA: hypothetical protein DIC49_01945 [Gammaproteobacteria bacterium]|nr:hypothetical protein [Gammaproteobacteria bacterium]
MVGCALPIKAPPEVKDLVKSDTAFFVEAVRSELDQNLSHLLVKLYRRNPIQLPATLSIEARVEQLRVPKLDLKEFGGPKPDDLVRMAFHEDFTGDRAYAFVAGLQSMVNHAFDHRREYLLLDDLPSAQFVYNSARNIETAAYLLRTQRNSSKEPYLFADGFQDDVLNASYSQLMGEMIGLQDALSKALAKKDQRALNAVARGAASFVFLPVGF